MSPLRIIAASFLAFLSGASPGKLSERFPDKLPERVYLTCYGYNPCAACSSCNYCAHCKREGGTCGVCQPGLKVGSTKDTVRNVPAYKPKDAYTSQCRAITKKGTRCLRSARSNGYCWQHGG